MHQVHATFTRCAATCAMLAAVLGGAGRAHAEDITALPYLIDTPGTYTLTADLHQIGSTAISITASDVILDLGGFTLSGTGAYKGGYAYGVGVGPGVSNVTIRNGTILQFEIDAGIMLYQVTGCTVSNVTVRECGGGITLFEGGGHTVENCTLDHNLHANVSLADSSGNIIDGNTCLGAGWSIRLGGTSSANSFLSNTCDGSSAAAIDLTGTDGNTVVDNTTTNAWIGIYGETSDDNHLQDNTTTGNAAGIVLHGDGNMLLANTALDNAETGITLSGTGNTVRDNTAIGNGTGIYIPTSNGNTIDRNIANGNVHDGIIVWTSSSGPCGGNVIRRNHASGNTIGIRVFGCNENTVQNNTALGNTTYGILMQVASSNVIRRNVALFNGALDLVDDACTNTWLNNTFVTSAGGRCIQ